MSPIVRSLSGVASISVALGMSTFGGAIHADTHRLVEPTDASGAVSVSVSASMSVSVSVSEGSASPDEPLPDPVPDPTPEPDPDPGDPDPGDADTDDDTGDADSGGIPWLPIVLLAVVVIALVAVVGRGGRRRTSETPRTRSSSGAGPPTIEQRVLRDAQWIHDQLSLQVLTGPGATSDQRWQIERSRVQVAARMAHHLASERPDQGFAELAAAIDSVTTALDTACAFRSESTADPTSVSEAVAVVHRQRQVLLEWIVAVRGRLGAWD